MYLLDSMQTLCSLTYFPAMASLPVVVFLAAGLLLSLPAEGKVRGKGKIFPELSRQLCGMARHSESGRGKSVPI